MTFDLNDLEAIDQATMEIHSRDGKPTGWIWTIAGPGHPQAIELSNRLGKERLARAKAQEMAQVNGRKWKGDDESPDEAMRRTAEMLVGRVLGWSPITMNGKDYPFTRDNAIALLMDPKRGDTLVSQLTDFLGDERSFMQRSATT